VRAACSLREHSSDAIRQSDSHHRFSRFQDVGSIIHQQSFEGGVFRDPLTEKDLLQGNIFDDGTTSLTRFTLNLETDQPNSSDFDRFPHPGEKANNRETVHIVAAAALVLSCVSLAVVVGLSVGVFDGFKRKRPKVLQLQLDDSFEDHRL
jgi:hypothetical protein